jgi:hypothetical protein
VQCKMVHQQVCETKVYTMLMHRGWCSMCIRVCNAMQHERAADKRKELFAAM